MLEIDFPDPSGWYPFFDELREIEMDTVVIAGIAHFTRESENGGHSLNTIYQKIN